MVELAWGLPLGRVSYNVPTPSTFLNQHNYTNKAISCVGLYMKHNNIAVKIAISSENLILPSKMDIGKLAKSLRGGRWPMEASLRNCTVQILREAISFEKAV